MREIPDPLVPAAMILISLEGRGLSLQSVMVKCLPLKSETPLDQRSFMIWTYSVAYSYR